MDILDKAKGIAEVVKKYNDLVLYKKIIDLHDEILQLKEESRMLRKENVDLKQHLETKADLVYEAPYYWRNDKDGKDGPFCQHCWDKDQKMIRLQKSSSIKGSWRCLSCKNKVHDSDYKPAPNRKNSSGGWIQRY